MNRFVLNDTRWERVAPLLPGKIGDPGRSAADNRRFLEAVLWIARVGAPWRDLPEMFGNWNSTFKRFRRWVEKDVFARLFRTLSGDPDFEYALIDWSAAAAMPNRVRNPSIFFSRSVSGISRSRPTSSRYSRPERNG